jgi:cobalamin biosynthesis protein CobW
MTAERRPVALGRIPATIVTGFLGAGKTTLIRHLLQNPGGRRIALIVNEFGDVGFDGAVLADCGSTACGKDDIIELSNGCICCAVADDFLPAMEKILGRDTPPDHIVIETSGLALPQPLVKAFTWPGVRSRVTVDAVVTVVDAAAVAEGRVASDEAKLAEQRAKDRSLEHDNPVEELFEDQLRCADLILISKTDLVDEAALARIEAAIAEDRRPAARTIRIVNGVIPADILLGQVAAAEMDSGNRQSHHELAGEEHEHDDFDTFVLQVETPDRQTLERRVAAAMRAEGVLRIKGLVGVAGRPAALAVQAVGPRVETWFVGDGGRALGLVVIGLRGLDRAAVEAALRVGG